MISHGLETAEYVSDVTCLKQGRLAYSKRSELAPHRLIAAHRRALLFERLVQAKGRSPLWFKTSPENEVNFRDIGNGQFDCPQNKIGKR